MFIGKKKLAGIYLHRKPVDLRKSINGLGLLVEETMGLDLFAANLFLFSNKRGDKLKILYWDDTGFALWYKRLEKSRFRWPVKQAEAVIQIEQQELSWLLEGYDIWKMEPHKKLSYRQVS